MLWMLDIPLINLLLLYYFYQNLVFSEIYVKVLFYLRHVNCETAFFFVVKGNPYPAFPPSHIANFSQPELLASAALHKVKCFPTRAGGLVGCP